jgi:hypothetical protein
LHSQTGTVTYLVAVQLTHCTIARFSCREQPFFSFLGAFTAESAVQYLGD